MAVSLFDPNLTVAQVRNALTVPNTITDDQLADWLNRMATVLIDLGLPSYFSLTTLEEETPWDQGLSVSEPIVKINSVQQKDDGCDVSIADLRFRKYWTYATLECYNYLPDCFEFGRMYPITESAFLDTKLECGDWEYNRFAHKYCIVNYETGLDLTDTKIRADILNALRLLYSNLGPYYNPNYISQGNTGLVRSKSVDDTSWTYQDPYSYIKQNGGANWQTQQPFSTILRMLQKYIKVNRHLN